MPLNQAVATLMRKVANDIVMPRYRMLAVDEIADKGAGEIVTSVDRDAERALSEGLERLGLSARIVGEEACAADPDLLDGIGSGLVWLVDPLDGTANYAAGKEPFGMMIALIGDGEPLAGWLLDPVSGRLCQAALGEGATIDGQPAHANETGLSRPVASLGTHFMSATSRSAVHAAMAHFDLEPVPRCAAESYPRLVLGRNDVALFHRILPWDHAAGVLFLTEAGGYAGHWDGQPYRVGSASRGVLLASSPHMADLAGASLGPILSDIAAPEPQTA